MNQDTTLQTSEETQPKPFLQSVGYAGGTFAGIGIIDAAAHLGPTGLVFAAIGSLIAYKHGADIRAGFSQRYASLDPQTKAVIQSMMQRFGHSMSEEEIATPAQPKLAEEEQVRAKAVKEAFDEEREVLAPIFPPYSSDVTMHLGKVVATRQRFDPSIDNFLGYGAIFAGSQGSGKSVAVAVVAEHLGEREMSEVLFDMKREYISILDVVSNGIVAGHPNAAKSQDFQGRPFYPLTVENAASFARDVMEKGYQAVVDIPSFLECSGNDWNLVAKVIAATLDGLMVWSIAQKDQDRVPCLVAFDEAHIFFPQAFEMKNLFDAQVINALNATAFSMVNMGRSYGYTMLFSTQRIANIAKWTIGNCQIKVIMRHSVDVDLDRCSKEVGKDANGKVIATEQDIKSLPAKQGYGYILGFTQEPYLIQFDMRRSYHPSNTPTMERVQQRNVKSAQPVQRLPLVPAQSYQEPEQITQEEFEELCREVIAMAGKGYKNGEIMGLLQLVGSEYREIVDHIKANRSAFRSVAPNAPQSDRRANLSVVRDVSETPRKLPGNSENAPQIAMSEPVEDAEFDFQAREDDLLLSELQSELLIVFYRNCNNVAKSLEQIKNDRGQGLGGRYTRHASYILEQAGLKKRRA